MRRLVLRFAGTPQGATMSFPKSTVRTLAAVGFHLLTDRSKK